jgi:hypothetical protein
MRGAVSVTALAALCQTEQTEQSEYEREGAIMSEDRSEFEREGSEFLEELHSLGQQLTAAVKSLWESEESRQLRQEIGDGFTELGQQLDSAIKSAQESDTAREFSAQVKETVDRARESDLAGKMEHTLAAGLRDLNEQLGKVVDSMEAQKPEAAEAEPEAETEA